MFRQSCNNYILEKDYHLYFLKTKSDKKEELKDKRKNNRHLKKAISDCEFFRIPNEVNVINLLDNIHSIILHQGTNKLKDKIEELKIYYYGIHEDIEQIKHLCPICFLKNMRFYKREPCKQIIMDRPLERFVIDLV